ncbi:MAG: Lnb N-terminal periplasmic domain-containing protein, partial [Limisphaerales bacterium]
MNVMDTSTEAKSVHATSWLRLLRTCCAALAIALLAGWATLAIYFGGAGEGALRMSLAIAFAAFSVWTWLVPRDKMKHTKVRLFWSVLFLLVLGWFSSIRPSHERSWRPEVAVLPRVTIENDRVRISGFRDFNYRSREDFDVRYREREVELSHLTSVDLFISYWDQGPMAHTFLSFGFDNAAPVCVSIEARLEKNESFAAAASLFKRFELIYVVGDERDLVRVRTTHRAEQVYLYPIKISAEGARRLFLVYAQRINRLADRPQFYHLLQNSCTANIVRNAKAAGHKTKFDGR